MRVHFVGVSGTGMGALAALFVEAGHEVSGSDLAFDPPIGPALEAAGVRCLRGYDAAHVAGDVDLVVVGNAIRATNPEAQAVEARGLPRTSMSGALRAHFLEGRRALVVCGTHGKTTTSSMAAWLLEKAGAEPGFFIGGVPKNFGKGAKIGRVKHRLGGTSTAPRGRAPFVVEGDEYDAVYWHKAPKFLDYVGVSEDDVVVLTSIEHDHIDIYPDEASYVREFERLVAALPAGGLLVVDARDPKVRAVAARARCRVVYVALDGDAIASPGGDGRDEPPTWLAAPVPIDEAGVQAFDVFVGGSSAGRFSMTSPGAHNVRNALAVIAACAEGFGIGFAELRAGLATFEGVKRRQDLVGEAAGVRVYDDFAHHPTAVLETLRALRQKHRAGKLFAVFEPRSATACRALHQAEYPRAFESADRVVFAPLGRTNVPDAERLDVARLTREIGAHATNAESVDAIVEQLARDAAPGDTVALLSNGAFGGIHQKLLAALRERD
ncbi:MAG: UDP-N-acetylmuramate:L-alanyl-gamma-D-glutamyl-meso-diaminopimelate ligase [Myxococcales bacterium]|nr:UDP-N-acetylmuramate:L-alanyl-gamma-D-glutamyl-meso-diaminopimelate ligase [Myxococcales bacterium]